MKFPYLTTFLFNAILSSAQTFTPFTDADGIEFWQTTFDTSVEGTKGEAQWGLALPPASETSLEDEYIGRIVVPKINSGTWLGLVHTSGMTNSLMLIAWLDDDEKIQTSFRYASGYVAPDIYAGNATLSMISEMNNATHYGLTYRCQACWTWEQDGVTGDQLPQTTASGKQLVGWAQATDAPTSPNNEDSAIKQHANAGILGAEVASARNSAYTKWTSLGSPVSAPPSASATASVSASASASLPVSASSAPSSSAPAPSAACPSSNPATEQAWDYIIVGAGAGGIPLADKLSETGKSVLLIERGPPSSGRWGGTLKPKWLVGTNLTRFDVPGLDNQIWVDSEGIACSDVGVMSGCVLGGGTAVNAGLWWRANPADFDYNFPAGWKSTDLEPAVARVFDRIPFTDAPSMDGIIYNPEGYDIIAGALAAAGWENVTAGEEPAKKNFTFSRPNHMFSHGERGGPLATYLVTASERRNFHLLTNTTVNRVVRSGSKITGVEMDAFLEGGECGVAKVKPTGKVILSAGAFGTPKILFRSGIGPSDQLEIVQEAEPAKMVPSSQWIDLPVGYNLDDHVNTDIVITHPDVSFYDFYAAYKNPIPKDRDMYLADRTGILAQSAPNIAVIFWHEIEGEDGITRQLQWQARVESAHDIESKKAMTISQYLGRGATSRGRTTINAGLNMVVSEVPYLQDENDVAAVAAGIETLKKVFADDPRIKIVYPPANVTTEQFLADYPLTTNYRTANHWTGSCQMGVQNDGNAVVDTNTKVFGTENLYVVDASIFPGMVSTNPSALIVAVAERAAEVILADESLGGGSSAIPGSSASSAVGSVPSSVSAIPDASSMPSFEPTPVGPGSAPLSSQPPSMVPSVGESSTPASPTSSSPSGGGATAATPVRPPHPQ